MVRQDIDSVASRQPLEQILHQQFEVLVEDRLGQYIKRYLVVGWEETLHTYFDSLPVSKLQTLHLKLHDSKVVAYPNCIFRQIIHQSRTCFFLLIGTIQCRCFHTLFGQLRLNIKRPQAVYLVAEEI